MEQIEADLTKTVDDGLLRAGSLKPGDGFFDLTAGVTQDMAFGRAEVGAHLSDAVTAFGFAQVQDDFAKPLMPEFSAGGGLRVIW